MLAPWLCFTSLALLVLGFALVRERRIRRALEALVRRLMKGGDD